MNANTVLYVESYISSNREAMFGFDIQSPPLYYYSGALAAKSFTIFKYFFVLKIEAYQNNSTLLLKLYKLVALYPIIQKQTGKHKILTIQHTTKI